MWWWKTVAPSVARAGLAMAVFAALAAGLLLGDDPPLASLSIEQLLQVKVTTASLHDQPIERAPANMTVVTAEDIRRYGWRTFGEVLNHVRGFYVSSDRTYQEAGTGGFSVPGDWSTRVLILVNGHNMTDNIFGSASYFDQDFVVDMTLVDRIEIVRGTSSSLYGSNGILATINVITKKAGAEPGTSVRAESGTLGEKRVTATGAYVLPHGMSLLASGTVFNDAGQHDIYIPEFDTSATNNGHAIDMDGDRGYRVFADFTIGNWEILAFTGTRVKIQPISWNDTVFNDRGTRATDQHSMVEAAWTHKIDEEHVLRWATSWDGYRYRGDYRLPLQSLDSAGNTIDAVEVNREFDAGDWITSRLTYRFPWFKGNMTAGGEGKFDLRALQSEANIAPVYQQQLYINKLDRAAAGFVQQEWNLGTRWGFTAGARYDWSFYRSSAVSPRGGVVFQVNPRTTVKLVYGRGFRNPNANELFFSDGVQQIGNPRLKPEQADSVEVGVYRTIAKSWKAGFSAYRMVDRGIIVPAFNSDGLSQFVNADRFHGIGIGGELNGKPLPFLEIDANFQQQQSWLENRATIANSPRSLGKLRFSVPLRGQRLMISGGLLYESEQRTLDGARLDPVWLPELTLVSKNWPRGVNFQAGVRNLANTRYVDPAGLTSAVDTIRQPGRTFFLTATRHFRKS